MFEHSYKINILLFSSCPAQPRHMNVYTDKYIDYNNGLMYENYYGGVVAMTVQHFNQVFSINLYS